MGIEIREIIWTKTVLFRIWLIVNVKLYKIYLKELLKIYNLHTKFPKKFKYIEPSV